MISVVCDTSVVLKWFHVDGEADVADAHALLAAHRSGRVIATVLDLTLYEIGNVLLRSLRWPAERVASQLDDVLAICSPLTPSITELHVAAELAHRHTLTFYDAVYAAVATGRSALLATADRELLRAGLGHTAGGIVADLAPS